MSTDYYYIVAGMRPAPTPWLHPGKCASSAQERESWPLMALQGSIKYRTKVVVLGHSLLSPVACLSTEEDSAGATIDIGVMHWRRDSLSHQPTHEIKPHIENLFEMGLSRDLSLQEIGPE